MRKQLLHFFTNPQNYPHAVGKVEQCETHAAMVFLAGDYAYKVKRGVKLPYLDFSTLEKRRQALQRELELNQPNAPQIYMQLVPVTTDKAGNLQLSGKGRVVEWAMKMRRFSQDDIFSTMLNANQLTNRNMNDLAAVIITSHANAPVFNEIAGASRTLALAVQIAANLERATARVSKDITRQLERSFAQALKGLPDLLDKRGAKGYVRRCHGDLHLSNIAMFNNSPVLFDALEFDEELGTCDVLYDLAFVLMDLLVHNQLQLANRLLNQYLHLDNDINQYEGLALLPVFIAMRAAIRAYVLADKARVQHKSTDSKLKAGVEEYLNAALISLETPPAKLIAIGGLSGSGKTTIASMIAPQIANQPGAVHLRSDQIRKQMFGIADTDRLRPDAYSLKVNQDVYRLINTRAEKTLGAGYSIIADAVFSKPEERHTIQQLAAEQGVDFTGIWLEAPEDILKNRVTGRRGDASDATAEVVKQQLQYATGDIEWHRIDAARDSNKVCADCIKLIHHPQPH